MTLHALAKMIDHSLLHPTMTDRELVDGCTLALRYDVASVCIKPYAVPLARDLLAGSDVVVGTVIGFPHGSSAAVIKLIFENDFLPGDDAKIRLCHLCNEHGVAFAKTSTGYGFVKKAGGGYDYAGATDHDLRLMRRECAPTVQIKAAGGVRTLDDLLRVRALGVTRAGATATAAILDEAARRKSPRQ
jgi:deoxyribose-phosphate aldolase